MSTTITQKSQTHLDWNRIREAIADRCRTPLAYDRARSLLPLSSRVEISESLALTSEARRLFDQGYRLPIGQPGDVRPAARLAARGGTLSPDELVAIGAVLESIRRCRRQLLEIGESAPLMFNFVADLVEQADLEAELRICFNDRGELSEHASGDLYDLRNRVETLHSQLKDTVHGLVNDSSFEGMLQDEYFTIREDRYVLPIRSGHKNHVDGIVHGWSGSGATVYIEPQKVVDANNRLVLAQAEVDREVRRILSKLSAQVGRQANEIEQALETLGKLDYAWACGHLSSEMTCSQPVIGQGSTLSLKNARHPLLLLSGTDVVPNDIELDGQHAVLVLTGPNTGGKTVALKTVGLCVTMALSGLHIPAAPGSKVPLSPSIFSDIGDEQNLDESLSTFSGHIANLNLIFGKLEEHSLVLLDELVVGTDPVQGAALAQAILEAFAELGAKVIVTTHYETLKLLPFTDDRFRNGAMGFDPSTGQPSYRLSLDSPGASSALQTARRLGLDDQIVRRAEELAGPQQQALQNVIETLEQERDQLHKFRTSAEQESIRLEIARKSFEARDKKLKERLKKGLENEQSAALTDARKLRDDLKQIRKSIRKKVVAGDADWLETAQKKAGDVASKLSQTAQEAEHAMAGPELDPASLTIGQAVWVVSLRAQATLTSGPDAKGRCEVKAGIMTAKVDLSDLRSNRFGKEEKKKELRTQKASTRPKKKGWDAVSPQIPDNTLDLRGARVSDALARVEQFLDMCYGRDFGSAFIIHGHGTGALKQEVRSWLRSSPYVSEQRPGLRHEGGDGVTAVLLADE
ncbi:MAG: endonuclease MutS2 [Myxococcota bacterium]|nr:endonuclease MutS2 [Myxococcota bacterium]